MLYGWKKRILFASALLLLIPLLGIAVSADLAANGKYVVVLDPGHGGIDGGSDVGTLTEKEYDLALAQGVRDALLADGRFEVYLTRSDNDTYLTMLERVTVAVEHHADLFLSLHCNSSPSPDSNGLMAYISLIPEYNAQNVSDRMLDAMSAAVGIGRGRSDTRADTGDALGVYYWNKEKQWDMPGAASLGTVSDYYSINTWSSRFGIPSIIMEHGYLTNAADLACLDGAESLPKMAWAEASAIISYFTDHEHQWGPVARDFPSNCVFDGTESSRCTICGCRNGVTPLPSAKDTDEGHYWRVTASEPSTCSTAGWAEYVCQISVSMNSKAVPFEKHTKREELPKEPHDLVTVSTTPASHGKDGEVVRRCQVCGELVTEVLPGEEHAFEAKKTVEPTCTDAGYTVEKCSVCGETRKVPGEPARHRLGEDGVCEVCGVTVTSVYPDGAIDPDCVHEWEAYEEPALCLEDGRTGRKCRLCGVCEYTAVPALGHDFEVRQSVEPTCVSEGLYRAECIRCGELDERTSPMKEHSFGVQTVNGKREYVCLFCGEPDPNAPTGEALYSVYEVEGEGGTADTRQPEEDEKKKSFALPVLIAAIVLAAAAIPVWIYLRNRQYNEEQERKSAARSELPEEGKAAAARTSLRSSLSEAKALRLALAEAQAQAQARSEAVRARIVPRTVSANAAPAAYAAASAVRTAEAPLRSPQPTREPVRQAQAPANPSQPRTPVRPAPANPAQPRVPVQAQAPANPANRVNPAPAQANPQNAAQGQGKPARRPRVVFSEPTEEEYAAYERYARAVQAARFARQQETESRYASIHEETAAAPGKTASEDAAPAAVEAVPVGVPAVGVPAEAAESAPEETETAGADSAAE